VIRPLHPIDVARRSLLGGWGEGNRAHTLQDLGRETRTRSALMEVARQSLSIRGKSIRPVSLVSRKGAVGIAAARPRSGTQAWEVSHLLLASGFDSDSDDLFGRLSQAVGRRGGERIFLRLRQQDPLVDAVRRWGFLPCVHEILYAGKHRPTADRPSLALRDKPPSDDYKLFQLYNASSPADYRFAAGVTFDQWVSAREKGRGRSREHVYETNGSLRGWVRTFSRSGVGQLSIMIHPEDERNVSALVDYGLRRSLKLNEIYCLVPEYQILLRRLLEQRGYDAVSEYVTLVKSMAGPVIGDKAREAVSIASS
jgi:hypothetical protein